jgi:hypothetical protein
VFADADGKKILRVGVHDVQRQDDGKVVVGVDDVR